MKKFLKRIWFPAAVVCFFAFQATGMDFRTIAGAIESAFVWAEAPSHPDTIKYRNQFIGNRIALEDTSDFNLTELDTVHRLTARDTIFPPDSLRDIDPFRYKYYVALLDSATHVFVRDSLKAAGDSIDWPKIDSIYRRDSVIRKKAEFDKWYNSLSKTDRKKYDYEQKSKLKKHETDSILAIKDSLGAIKDSIKESTPRVLETFALPDSMQYKRIIQWTHEREFHRMDVQIPDTTYNFHYHDYPIFRSNVNATWLGLPGSPAQPYDYMNRESQNGVSFYEPYESWTYSAKTAPMYNTKTPYTELAYYGTLFAPSQKESDNLHILTTQNIFPALNFTLEYDRFGSGGMMDNETTKNKTFLMTTNYLGKRYLMHAGYIYNMVSREENGGTSDNTMVRDTTLDAREYPIVLSEASTRIKKNTLFLDQQYRIPFTFLKDLKYSKQVKAEKAYRDSVTATGDSAAIAKMQAILAARQAERDAADTTGDQNITNAFIGHSTEYSVYTKHYEDQISTSDNTARDFYNNNFFYNPTNSSDSMRVMKLENRLFLRLQPWSSEAIVSKINGGVGDRLRSFYTFDPTFLNGPSNKVWNSAFVYAGVEGQLKSFIQWNATGDYVFLGDEINDFSIKANALMSFYPFRKAKHSPVSMNIHFEQTLEEPEYYLQHFYSNHLKWDNDFGKTSTTKIQAHIAVPRWNVALDAGYALLSNNIYFDSTMVVRQNSDPMSVFSASLTKNLALGPVHLDNRILFQMSSNQDVVPLPTLAFNERLYLQFFVKKNILQMQLGAEAWYNTKYYSPGWNPNYGAFYNQKEVKYNNGPIIDAFVNMQWKRCCVFVKVENAGQGWPMEKADYFTANHYIRTQRAIKFGVYWPFYRQTTANKQVDAGSGLSSGSGSGSSSSSGSMSSSSSRSSSSSSSSSKKGKY